MAKAAGGSRVDGSSVTAVDPEGVMPTRIPVSPVPDAAMGSDTGRGDRIDSGEGGLGQGGKGAQREPAKTWRQVIANGGLVTIVTSVAGSGIDLVREGAIWPVAALARTALPPAGVTFATVTGATVAATVAATLA